MINFFQKLFPKVDRPLLRLSPTTGIALFNDCPHCFWTHYREGIKRPRGIYPSLPSGMDIVIKEYFDLYRGKLPPELVGEVKGNLIKDVQLINQWRHWQTGLKYPVKALNAELFGALDDCSYDGKKYYPIDYKTRGFAPKVKDSVIYYEHQLDAYALLLEANGYPTGRYGYLVYYWPFKVRKNKQIEFNVEVIKLRINVTRAKTTFENAVRCIKGLKPAKSPHCEYCNWRHQK